jgi:hypothetical protein
METPRVFRQLLRRQRRARSAAPSRRPWDRCAASSPAARARRRPPRPWCALLQEHVGEAARRGADVEGHRPAGVMPKTSSACASFRPPRPTYG